MIAAYGGGGSGRKAKGKRRFFGGVSAVPVPVPSTPSTPSTPARSAPSTPTDTSTDSSMKLTPTADEDQDQDQGQGQGSKKRSTKDLSTPSPPWEHKGSKTPSPRTTSTRKGVGLSTPSPRPHQLSMSVDRHSSGERHSSRFAGVTTPPAGRLRHVTEDESPNSAHSDGGVRRSGSVDAYSPGGARAAADDPLKRDYEEGEGEGAGEGQGEGDTLILAPRDICEVKLDEKQDIWVPAVVLTLEETAGTNRSRRWFNTSGRNAGETPFFSPVLI